MSQQPTPTEPQKPWWNDGDKVAGLAATIVLIIIVVVVLIFIGAGVVKALQWMF